jgi:DNA-binding LytR/AlgR family response regulator
MADSIQFALDSYDMQYADYLLNPFSVTKLDFIMERFIKKFYTKTYSVKSYSKFINIPYNEIIYIESDNSRCILHTVNKKLYTIYGKRLSIIGAELDDKRFLRCHYSCIVNMDYIASADREFILTTGDIVNIRQRSLKSIKDAYLEYISFRGEKETDNG